MQRLLQNGCAIYMQPSQGCVHLAKDTIKLTTSLLQPCNFVITMLQGCYNSCGSWLGHTELPDTPFITSTIHSYNFVSELHSTIHPSKLPQRGMTF